MPNEFSLLYGYDTLCGWCYGFIPTLRGFSELRPDVKIEVVPYGLFTGDRAKPYSHLIPHIRKNEVLLEEATGYKPSEVFHEMIANDAPLSESACPGHAVLQMQDIAPDRVVEFSHILQEVHYRDGKDLCSPQTYKDVIKEHGFPALDTDAIAAATCETPIVAASFSRAAELDIRPLPTLVVLNAQKEVLGRIRGVFTTDEFCARFDEITGSA